MDVKRFQDSRKEELESFQKTYDMLKREYSNSVAAAINEKDPVKQKEMVDRVLGTNARLAEEIRTITGRLNKGDNGFNYKELDDLTADLIKYQKDYAELEKTKDKVQTLKMIHESMIKKLNTTTTTYYFYEAVVLILAFYVAYLVFTTSLGQSIKAVVSKVAIVPKR